MIYEHLCTIINKNDTFAIAGHVNPDGDCIGACTALALALTKMGKRVKVYLEKYPNVYKFLDGQQFVRTEVERDSIPQVFIALDCGDVERLTSFKHYLKVASNTINIDHHKSNTKFGDYNLVLDNASSTCEIIYKLINRLGVEINTKIAEALFAGIVYDTGVFRHTNTTAKTHKIAAELYKYDIRANKIINDIFYTKSYKASKLLGRALDKMELVLDNKVVVSTFTMDDLKHFGAESGDLDGVIQFMNQVDCVEAAAFLYEKNDYEVKVSLRSKHYLDVSALAKVFNGGGHERASGCTINSELDIAKRMIVKEFSKRLQ